MDRSDLQQAGVAAAEALSPLERLEMMLHPWVGFAVMPIFALANAGVTFAGADIRQPVIAAIFPGLVFGKPAGVLAFTWSAVRLGWATSQPTSADLVGSRCLPDRNRLYDVAVHESLAYAPDMLLAAKSASSLHHRFGRNTSWFWSCFVDAPLEATLATEGGVHDRPLGSDPVTRALYLGWIALVWPACHHHIRSAWAKAQFLVACFVSRCSLRSPSTLRLTP